jgi:hypothetical protein
VSPIFGSIKPCNLEVDMSFSRSPELRMASTPTNRMSLTSTPANGTIILDDPTLDGSLTSTPANGTLNLDDSTLDEDLVLNFPPKRKRRWEQNLVKYPVGEDQYVKDVLVKFDSFSTPEIITKIIEIPLARAN